MMLSGPASYVPSTPDICVIDLGDRVRIIRKLHILIAPIDQRVKLKRLRELRDELGRRHFSHCSIVWILETYTRVNEDDLLPLFVSAAALFRIVICKGSRRDQIPVIILVILVIRCDLQHINARIRLKEED